jgi:hypothetical protein
MENKEDKHSKFANIIVCLSPINFILSIVLILIYSIGYNLEKLYCDVIKMTWYGTPIADISLKKENESYHPIKLLSLENKDTFCDCSHVKKKSSDTSKGECSSEGLSLGCNQYNSSKIASKYFNTTLFISSYYGNYWTFYDRIRKNSNGEITCQKDNENEKYKLCGYLDQFKNPLCVLEGETCPLYEIKFDFNPNKDIINITSKTYGVPEHNILNRIIASEIKDADVFDINQILTYKNKTNYKKNKDENIFKLNFLRINCSKIYFYQTNNFTNEPFPDWFKDENIYFYSLIYPGNSFENQIKERHKEVITLL